MNARIWWAHASHAIAAEGQSFKQQSKSNDEHSSATDTASPPERANGVGLTSRQIGATSNEAKVDTVHANAQLTPNEQTGGTQLRRSTAKYVANMARLVRSMGQTRTLSSKNDSPAARQHAQPRGFHYLLEKPMSARPTTQTEVDPESTMNSSQTTGRSRSMSINPQADDGSFFGQNIRPRLPIWLSLGWNSQIRLRAARRRSMLRHPAQRRRD